MRFLFVGSHVCSRSRLLSRRSPSRHPLTGLSLPSASSFARQFGVQVFLQGTCTPSVHALAGRTSDEVGKGTHYAGIVAAMNNAIGVIGVAPNAKLNLHSVKIYGTTTTKPPSISTLIKGALACVQADANVIYMPFQSPIAPRILRAMATVFAKHNILMIAPAGNNGDTSVAYPASLPEIISVAAIDSTMEHLIHSQSNPYVELSAPGAIVYSTVPMGTGREALLSVAGIDYPAFDLTGTPLGSASAELYDFGKGEIDDAGVSGKICLIERGNNTFGEKVSRCENNGGVGTVIYDNVHGNYLYTLGDTVTTIPSMMVSQENGADLANQIGQTTNLSVVTSNYDHIQGTYQAGAYVAAVASLVWSRHPECTAEEIRATLRMSALPLGDTVPNDQFGYGLVQAKTADERIDMLGCGQ